MRFDIETPLPDGWFWEGDNLGITQEFLEKRPLSYSSLSKFRESPRHYASKFITKAKKDTEAQYLGKIVEALIFESKDTFNKKYQVYVPFKGVGSQVKNNEIKENAKNNKIGLITKEQYDIAEYCKMGVMDNPESRKLIENSKNHQNKLVWRNKKTNLPLVGYIDFESTAWETDFIVDFKTGRTADPVQWSRDATNFGYHLQAATYTNAYKRKYFKFPSFIFLVVETKEPFNVSLNFVEGSTLERAQQEFLGTLLAFRKCMDEKLFHMGYEFQFMGRDYFSYRLPGWYRPKYGGLE